MEGPGGYQFVGRTCQMWNTYRQTGDFTDGKPWLLRFFDQVRFYPVGAAELLRFRDTFLQGKVKLEVSHETFSLRKYNQFLTENRSQIASFKSAQQAAFEAERARWEAAGQLALSSEVPEAPVDPAGPDVLPPGWTAVFADVPGNMWKLDAAQSQRVAAGDRLAVIESMKMEIPVISPVAGTVADVFCTEGRVVSAGQVLFSIKPAG